MPQRVKFPWSKDHGLIEAHRESTHAGRQNPRFPWSKDHGLIEARRICCSPAGFNQFPWSKDHGLIEARVAGRAHPARETDFRGRKITASLKPEFARRVNEERR